MAPIFSAEVGITPQIIDDERLVNLRKSLAEIDVRVELGKTYPSPDEVEVPLDIDHFISLIEPWQSWTFEEQVGSENRDNLSHLNTWIELNLLL